SFTPPPPASIFTLSLHDALPLLTLTDDGDFLHSLLLPVSVLFCFFLGYNPAQTGAGKPVIAAIKIQVDAFFFTVLAAGEVLIFIFITNDAYVQFKRPEDVLQVLFGRVGHYLVNVLTAAQLDVALHHGLGGFVFLRSV